MNDEDKRTLYADPDGLLTYEYIANHIGDDNLDVDWLVDNMIHVDANGQFTGSAARYLHAIDPNGFAQVINKLVAATIDKDREHRYLQALIQGLWGDDYAEHAAELSASDDNFRRIYKRLHPTSVL
jgi:hypothetical protein